MAPTHRSQSFFGHGSSKRATRVYNHIKIDAPKEGFVLGPYNSFTLLRSPNNIGFQLSRHKFVAKMFQGYRRVLEVGCQEGLGSSVVAAAVGRLVSVDFYRPHIESCLGRLKGVLKNVEFRGHDMIDGPIPGGFDGAFSMDVLEHIDPRQEHDFMSNLRASLSKHGVLILGTPSLESQKHASPASRDGHINCKSGEAFRAFCKRYFRHVFIFGMNDEVVHTGFLPMAHYLIALCAEPLGGTPSRSSR